jgi:hypothetical protein
MDFLLRDFMEEFSLLSRLIEEGNEGYGEFSDSGDSAYLN